MLFWQEKNKTKQKNNNTLYDLCVGNYLVIISNCFRINAAIGDSKFINTAEHSAMHKKPKRDGLKMKNESML